MFQNVDAKTTDAGRVNRVLLVSLDGFRADKFDKFITDNPSSYLSRFIRDGVKASYMK